MPALYNGKAKGKSNGKTAGYNVRRGMKRSANQSIYKAVFGGRAKVAPSKKYARNTPKWEIFEKIIKLIKRQHEPGLSDLERSASSNRAMAMCNRHGIEIQDALDDIEFRRNHYQGGSSTVIIKHRDHFKYQLVRQQTFLLDLTDSVSMLFDVDSYTELRNGVLRVTFFGIASNTISAQLAFRMVYNEAVEMGQVIRGIGPRNSYLLGVAAGMWDKAVYRITAIKEKIARAKELAATTFSNETFAVNDDEDGYEPDFNFDIGPLQEDTDEDMEGIEENADTEETLMVENDKESSTGNAMEVGIIQEKKHKDAEDEDDEEEEGGRESRRWVQDMLILADQRVKIKIAANEWLAEQGIKLRAQRKRPRKIFCDERFEEGKEDSKDIDLGEKKICFALNEHLKTGGKEDALEQD